MAHGFVNVTNQKPCPVCGKPDWCGWCPDEDGYFTLVCQRSQTRGNLIGSDGKFYVYVNETKGGALRYEEAVQRKERQDAWCKERGYHRKEKNPGKDAVAGGVLKQKRQKERVFVSEKIERRSHKELDKIYRSILGDFLLEDYHRDYLKKEGWSDELIERNLIRSFPENDYVRSRYKNYKSYNKYRRTVAEKQEEKFGKGILKGVPGAYMDKSGRWTFAGPKGILFPLYDENGLIFGLRIRRDYMDFKGERKTEPASDDWYVDENGVTRFIVPMKGIYTFDSDGNKVFDKLGGKYRPFQSYHEEVEETSDRIIVKNSYEAGCAAYDQIGIYWNKERDTSFLAYLTEGEKKGIYANNNLHAPVISVPGVGAWSKLLEGPEGSRVVDQLKARGVKMFVIAYDADKEENKAVMKQQENVIKALKQEGFYIGTAEWNIRYGKGLDDLLAGGRKPGYELVD